MPYSNFDDTHTLQSVFEESKQQDDDMNMTEFVFEKLLTVGSWFEDDEDNDHDIPPHHQSAPLQIQNFQSGFLYCSKMIVVNPDDPTVNEKPSCMFRETKMSLDFHTSVFRPPVLFA